MSTAGLVTMWASDCHKIRAKLAELRIEVERLGVSPLIKDDMKEKIFIINRLLNKGRANEADNRK